MVTEGNATVSSPYTVASSITSRLIKSSVPDYPERIFYISGTHSMVNGMQDILSGLGVPKHQIKTDFFPGYA
jgi:ferredoxin-NADP reductase